MSKTLYVLGFMFSNDRRRVLLIKKERPDWQKGKLNGIGGHLQNYASTTTVESFIDAMVREFEEETGVITISDEWEDFLNIDCGADDNNNEPGYIVRCFRIFASDEIIKSAKTQTNEKVGMYFVHDIVNHLTIPNLAWIVPLALDKEPIYTAVNY